MKIINLLQRSTPGTPRSTGTKRTKSPRKKTSINEKLDAPGPGKDGEKAEILLGINMRDLIIVLYPAPLAENR
jgi:hypothetical protein